MMRARSGPWDRRREKAGSCGRCCCVRWLTPIWPGAGMRRARAFSCCGFTKPLAQASQKVGSHWFGDVAVLGLVWVRLVLSVSQQEARKKRPQWAQG